ncbi:MAG: B12-binding domain-containing radical SAM protein [Firmicutes bacterium]|nr:B12-binding domain-containing radical SAM protein [Bacillota bacterium]
MSTANEVLKYVTVVPLEKPLWWNKSSRHLLRRIIFIAPDSPASKLGKVTVFRVPSAPLLAIAAHTRQLFGDSIECVIVDKAVGDAMPRDITPDKDVVALTAVTSNVNYAYLEANKIKEEFGPVPVIVGGHHVTHLPEEALYFVDVVVRGEAESVWPKILDDLKSGNLQAIYDGTQFTVDISAPDFPIPDVSLVQQPQKYASFTVGTSRGCINNCPFCDMQAFYGKKPVRFRNYAHLEKEINSLPKRPSLTFADDNILNDRERAIRLAHILGDSGMAWICNTDIRIADDPELLNLFAKKGCFMIAIGFESIDKEAIKYVGKAKVNLPENYGRQIKNIHAAGLSIYAQLMFGIPGTKYPDTFQRTIDWLKTNGIEFAQMSITTPLPGTALRQRMIKENRLLTAGAFGRPISWDDYDFTHVVYSPEGITPEQLQRGFHWAWNEFYGDSFGKSLLKNLPKTLKSSWLEGWSNCGLNLKHRLVKTVGSLLLYESVVNKMKLYELEKGGVTEKVSSL